LELSLELRDGGETFRNQASGDQLREKARFNIQKRANRDMLNM